MKKTKLVNDTGSSIILKEDLGGVYRTLCPELKTGNSFTIKVDTNATYREYWLALPLDEENHVVLSSDDCQEYEEVRIKFKEDKYTWDALKRGSHEFVEDAGDKEASKKRQASPSTPDPGFIGKSWNKLKNLFP